MFGTVIATVPGMRLCRSRIRFLEDVVMFFARTLSAAAVLLGLATASANATLLVNTAPMTGTGSWGLNASARLAQSFIAASTDLDDIYLWMSKKHCLEF